MDYILDSMTVIDSLDKLSKMVSSSFSRYPRLEILYFVLHRAILQIVKHQIKLSVVRMFDDSVKLNYIIVIDLIKSI